MRYSDIEVDEWLPEGRHRHMCDVLEEMRKCYKTYNFNHMLSLIEEAQSMANRMESGLHDKRDYHSLARSLRKVLEGIRERSEAERNKILDEEQEDEQATTSIVG